MLKVSPWARYEIEKPVTPRDMKRTAMMPTKTKAMMRSILTPKMAFL